MSKSRTSSLTTNGLFDSRTRMLSVRLSAEEYKKFRELCLTAGIRSLSELARVAINQFVNQPATFVTQSSFEVRLSEVEAKLHLLSLEMKGIHKNRPMYDPPLATG